MRKRITILVTTVLLMTMFLMPVSAATIEQKDTPDYKVAFYAFDCYHMQDDNGKKSGYGYEMMQNVSKYLQCTFSYVGYDKSAKECEEMLKNGEIDIYTAAKKTEEREKEFAFSRHPAITATTCMNVKVGNKDVVAGDYSTYEGLRVGLLARHTYNDKFLAFVKEKGFSCEIKYYDTPTELTSALVNDEVDALVNSYIGIPEDERTVENFGQTPYYIMARKADQSLIDEIDSAIDSMNIETPNWRTELYNEYYGSENQNTEFTEEEQKLLNKLQEENVTIRAVMNPDAAPYSWYEDGEAKGIVADMFRATAEELNLDYKIVPVENKKEYEELIENGDVDIWMDLDGSYEDEKGCKYKITEPYLTTTISVLRNRGASEKIKTLAVLEDKVEIREILEDTWPDAEIISVDNTEECARKVVSGDVDAALLMSYSAQKIAREDIQNRLRAEIVPGATLNMQMGVNANDDSHFYGLWEKTLANVSEKSNAEIVQSYLEESATPTMIEYLFDHPVYLVMAIVFVCLLLFVLVLYLMSVRSKNKQKKIAGELAVALEEAKEANDSKQNFFSKMSHDIRTPLNVVLGMTQIAQKYKHDVGRLENALDSIQTEGNYLLVLINSILDVNQLEHGHVELVNEPFNLSGCLNNSIDILRPLVEKKEQELTVECEQSDFVVVGDANRFSQIVINIISNAIKYTEPGGKIKISLEYLPEGSYRFRCADNGIGMTEEFVEHICEDYSRAEDSRVSKTQGTGLGMSVVKGFTELMQGTLEIESELGAGTTFTIEIPFQSATEEQRENVISAEMEHPEEFLQFTGKKVLLVEDNALNAEIATELLESIGLSVDWADNGKIGVDKFEESKPGEYFAVFMDMQMPVMDGLEATRKIRNSERPDNDVPVFAMTANTFASDRKSCRDAGMNGYIPKPISMKDIETTLKDEMNIG